MLYYIVKYYNTYVCFICHSISYEILTLKLIKNNDTNNKIYLKLFRCIKFVTFLPIRNTNT
jgi:hypothetical protein